MKFKYDLQERIGNLLPIQKVTVWKEKIRFTRLNFFNVTAFRVDFVVGQIDLGWEGVGRGVGGSGTRG